MSGGDSKAGQERWAEQMVREDAQKKLREKRLGDAVRAVQTILDHKDFSDNASVLFLRAALLVLKDG
jgi:predicted phage-related endonuclease